MIMKNNEKIKNQIQKIGFGRTLQCLIEIVDDSIHTENTPCLWKLILAEHLEHAYDSYMNKGQDTLCELISND